MAAIPTDCTCTCGGFSRHWLPIVDGLVECEVVACACKVAPDAICSSCGLGFLRPSATASTCYACWASDKASAEAKRFAPLTDALRARGIEPEAEAWNTGGGVMCWEVHLPPVTIDGKSHTPYLLFSDEAEVNGCGLYLGTDATGINLEPTTLKPYFSGKYGMAPRGWATSRQGVTLGEATAEWLAAFYPALLEWYATIEWSWEPDSYGGTFTPHYGAIPAFPDTVVTDYDAQ